VISSEQRRAALLVAACLFMEMLDGTIVTTSAHQIAHALSVPVAGISLAVSAYLVTLAALIPLGGWLSARFGARRIFIAAIAIFTLASLGCAAAQTLPELVVMRVFQGVGGAMMVPIGRLIVLSRSPKAEIMRMTAYLVWPALIAPVIAPLAGGLITTYASWHWLFLINVPLGVIATAAAWRVIHPQPLPRPARLDLAGVLLTSAGLAGLTITAALLARPTFDAGLVLGVGVPSLVLIAVAVHHLLRSDRPLIELRTLHNHALRSAVAGTSIYFVVIGAAPFLVPLLFQQVFGWSAVKSGALVLFIFVGNVGIKPATTFLYGRFGFRAVLITATSIQAAVMAVAGFITASVPLVLIALVLVVSGAARSVGATGYSTLAFSEVHDEQLRHANTLFATVQQLGIGFGVAFAAVALRLGEPVGHLVSSRPGTATPYTVAFLAIGLLSLVATAGAVRLQPGAGDVLRRPRSRQVSAPPARP
jgi:EmrB/QacA subfamily drug resistance transporter